MYRSWFHGRECSKVGQVLLHSTQVVAKLPARGPGWSDCRRNPCDCQRAWATWPWVGRPPAVVLWPRVADCSHQTQQLLLADEWYNIPNVAQMFHWSLLEDLRCCIVFFSPFVRVFVDGVCIIMSSLCLAFISLICCVHVLYLFYCITFFFRVL